MPKRRKYSAEFKREAVLMARQPGVTKALCEALEIDEMPAMIYVDLAEEEQIA